MSEKSVENLDDPSGLDRRGFLELLGGSLIVAAIYPFRRNLLDMYLPDPFKPDVTVPISYQRDRKFHNFLKQLYGDDFSGFQQGQPNVLFDVIPVGDSVLQEGIAESIEKAHTEQDINAIVSQRQDSFSRYKFFEHYGYDADKILANESGSSGFVKNEVSQKMDEAAVQVILAPDDLGVADELLVSDKMDEDTYGAAINSVVLVPDRIFKELYSGSFEEGKFKTLMHEIGHIYGLEHSTNSKDLMYEDITEDSRPYFTPKQWCRIKKRVRILNLPELPLLGC